MAHMPPEEFVKQCFEINDNAEMALIGWHQWLECLSAYHDYTLEEAAEDAEVHYPASNNLNPTINLGSILQHKFKKLCPIKNSTTSPTT